MTNIASPQELKVAVARFCGSDLSVQTFLDDQIKTYLDSLQEKPYLLDSVLADCASALANAFLKDPEHSDRLLNVLYLFCKTRGAKTLLQFLPSEPTQLVPLLELIEKPLSQWTTRYALLLWLAACLYTPFRLDVLGDVLFDRLFDVAARFLVVSGLERDAAALMMSRLVTRDTPPLIQKFVDWADKQSPGFGVLRAASYIAVQSTPEYDDMLFKLAEKGDTNSATLHRYAIKIKTRIALRNFEFMEEAITTAMEALSSGSTAVRYSAAKAVGKIASKLYESDPEPAREIREAVLDVFDRNALADGKLDLVSDDEWHGALLAVAEMLRHSLPTNIERTHAVLEKALFFEQKRSTFSLGVNVRDAACYVCWSLFRHETLPVQLLERIYSLLISLACFDREVNVRRAAAAALQEGLGRQQGYSAEKAMLLIELLNFQSVTQVSRGYLEIAVKLGADYKYLLSHGVLSWDPSIRRLAAKSCGMMAVPVGDLTSLYSARDKDSQHGVLLALAAVRAPASAVEPLLEGLDFSSDLLCEAALRGLKCVPDRFDLATQCLQSSDRYVMQAATDLFTNLPVSTSTLDEWLDKMHLSPTFVVALATRKHQPALELACELPDPESRKIALLALAATPRSQEIVLNALDDYSTDARGDVGSWVREAAIRWTANYPTEAAIGKVWRLAAEPLDKLRLEASRALAKLLGLKFDWSTPANYFCRLLELAESHKQVMNMVLLGFIQSCGAVRASKETLTGSILGAVRYAQRHDAAWLDQLLAIDWRGKYGPVLLSTLEKLVTHGIELPEARVLPIAYNGSLNTRNPHRLLPSIGVLGCLDDPRAHNRLVKMLRHPLPGARVRAAEALAEKGYNSSTLIETEWDGNDFDEAAKSVERELKI